MGRIRVMPPALANQIAAGEVVERPASCVKELVENSLDAGARHIHVSLEQGGISAIVVQDDGCGMDEEDAQLAFARHATSKIMNPRDLFRISTLGFRGEALASIAAVSRVTLTTRRPDAEHGVCVTVEGTDRPTPPTPVGMAPGTRIEVRDLFFNTPARLKYLRSVWTEQARCVEVVQKAALARPDVAFVCQVEGRTVFRSSGRGDLLEVLAALLGVGEARQLLRVEGTSPDYRVWGFIGRPTQGKTHRGHGHLFVNGRPIRNHALHQAIVAGYQGRLMVGRHPVYALHIELDPALVDVNIHPHKTEVRFSEERDVAQLLERCVTDALARAFLVPSVDPGAPRRVPDGEVRAQRWNAAALATTSAAAGDHTREDAQTNPDDPARASGSDAGAAVRLSSDRGRAASVPLFEVRRGRWRPSAVGALRTALEPATVPQSTGGGAGEDVSGAEEAAVVMVRESSPDASRGALADTEQPPPDRHAWALRPVAQVLGMYIVAEDGDSVYLIDQHAAHERVLFERFSKRLAELEIHQVPLLTPLTLRLSPTEFEAFSRHRDELSELGMTFDEFGGMDVVLRAVPDIWEGLDIQALAEDLIRSLPQLTKTADPRERLREWVVTKACKAAIKANHRLSDMEMEALCEALMDLDDPFHCPHGRPVFIRLTRAELDRHFRRTV